MDILTTIAKRDDSAEHPTGNAGADRKLRAIARAKRRGAKDLTAEEYAAVEAAPGWFNGWLMVGKAQIVVKDRGNGTFLAYRL